MLPSDIDSPDVGSIEIRIYPITGSTVTIQPGESVTTTTDVSQSSADALLINEFNRTSGGAGLLADTFQGGPIRVVTKTVTATGSPITVTTPTVGAPIVITNFLSYDFRCHYLSMPCDAASFTVSEDALSRSDRQAIRLASKVEIYVGGLLQMTGFLDTLNTSVAHGGGTILRIEARSWISQAVDSHIDPQTRFSESLTLLQMARSVLAPFGVTATSDSGAVERNAKTGSIRGIRTTKKGKNNKSAVLHQEKPYPQEGAWAFLCRVCQRFGVWPRASFDGKTVILDEPDFVQETAYRLVHVTDTSLNKNNVLASDVRRSREEQPTVVFAAGVGGGGDFPKSSLRGAIINPLIAPQSPATLQNVLGAYPSVRAVSVSNVAIASSILDKLYPDPVARPLFLYDSESHTQDQLDAYLRREMSLRVRKALDAKYTILGHRLGGKPVAVDTMIDVQDDRSDLHIPMYVIGIHMQKSTGGGTFTELELIRPGSIFFS